MVNKKVSLSRDCFFADFETTADKDKPQVFIAQIIGKDFTHNRKPIKSVPNKWRVIIKDDYKVIYTHRLGYFMELCLLLDRSPVIYFNNLANFDGHFIYPHLKAVMRYTEIHDMSQEDLTVERVKRIAAVYKPQIRFESELLKVVKKHWNKVFANEFRTLIDENQSIFYIRIGKAPMKVYKKQKMHSVTFKCYYMLFRTPVAKMGAMIGDGTAKLELDRSVYKTWTQLYPSLDALESDKQALEYAIRDVEVMLAHARYMNDHGLHWTGWKLTASSLSVNEWVKSYALTYMQKFDARPVEVNGASYYVTKKGKLMRIANLGRTMMRRTFPVKWLMSQNEAGMTHEGFINRYLYKGGLTYINEQYRGRLVNNVTMLDKNGSYGGVLGSKTHLCPYGEPVIGDADLPYKMYEYTLKTDVYNATGLPFLVPQSYDVNERREYPRVLHAGERVYADTNMLPFVKEYYKLNEQNSTRKVLYSFKAEPFYTLFGHFVTKWQDVKQRAKQRGNKALEQLAKLIINSLYGKFGFKSDRTTSYMNDLLEWVKYDTVAEPMYLPVAVAITNVARMFLVEAVGHMHRDLVYTDTDSVVLRNYKPERFPGLLHETTATRGDTRYWKVESDFNGSPLAGVYFLGRRTKQYCFYDKALNAIKPVFASLAIRRELWPELTPAAFISGIYNNRHLKVYMLNKIKRPTGIYLDDTFYKVVTPAWAYPPLREQFITTMPDYSQALNISAGVAGNNILQKLVFDDNVAKIHTLVTKKRSPALTAAAGADKDVRGANVNRSKRDRKPAPRKLIGGAKALYKKQARLWINSNLGIKPVK